MVRDFADSALEQREEVAAFFVLSFEVDFDGLFLFEVFLLFWLLEVQDGLLGTVVALFELRDGALEDLLCEIRAECRILDVLGLATGCLLNGECRAGVQLLINKLTEEEPTFSEKK